MKTKQPKLVPKQTLPGAVIRQYVRCGRASCRCAAGELHGPYMYRKWREGGRQRKTYIRPADIADVRAACEEYRETLRLFRAFRDIGRREWSYLAGLLKEGGYA